MAVIDKQLTWWGRKIPYKFNKNDYSKLNIIENDNISISKI